MSDAIAVVGYAGRFPGAEHPDDFWNNLIAGRETIRRFSEEETEFSLSSPEAVARGEKFVRARGVLDSPDLFDAAFFGVYPREAEVMDPQHRIFLECSWEAIEMAGYDPLVHPGLIGVYAGASLNTYLLHNLGGRRGTPERLAGNYQVGEYSVMLGNDKDFLPVRVAYKLNLRGPAMAVQSACSTSLVAISQACSALQTWQCDMALAGGVSITFPQYRDYRYVEDGMVSGDGTCRAFDAGARGTVFGHGCGVVLLKRLKEAVADGDTIHAVLKGWAVNNDGSEKVGFAAPGVQAQAEVIALAQAAADVPPGSISYVEAHGTGTPLGDPIEVAALTQAFREGGATGNRFCALGTGKTHIGHLDVAAGAVGLIKVILQLRHEKIPALLHFQSPNPAIAFEESPFRPVAAPLDWRRGSVPRRAGVSAFGVGGTNAHIVVEEPPVPVEVPARRTSQLLVLSAKSPSALEKMSANLALKLEAGLEDISFTLAAGRRAFPFRRHVVASDPAEAAGLLRAEFRPVEARDLPPVAFLLPGQGSQHAGMGRRLYDAEPVFRRSIDECAQLLMPELQGDLRDVLFAGEDSVGSRRIHETIWTQPAIFAFEYALARQWMEWGIRPSVLIGHSIGEYVAAVLAGAFPLDGALNLLAARARLMQDLPSGSMLAVRLPATGLKLPAGLSLAASNSPKLSTVSGPHEDVRAFQAELEARKVPSRRLETSHAFHSSMMDGIVGPFSGLASRQPAAAPAVRWISTLTGCDVTVADLRDGTYWARQLREPVLFDQALKAAGPDFVFLECGPGRALGQFAAQSIGADAIASAPGDRDEVAELQSALGALWCRGVAPDWSAYFEGGSQRRVPLPTYPFERKSYWIAPEPSDALGAGGDDGGADPMEEMAPGAPEPARIESEAGWETSVAALISELSGHEVADPSKRFVELGFDSLFLTQLSQAIHSRFGVKVTFRELLGSISTVSALSAHVRASAPSAPPPHEKPSARSRVSRLPAVHWPKGHPPAAEAAARFGPYKPIERASGGGLTPRQQAALEALIARYVARTAGSKAHAAEHRPHYADPRAVAGFHPLWKEMVYPIVSAGSLGSRITDVDGNSYVDMTMGFGTYFFGHSPQWLVEAVSSQLGRGIEIGPQSATAGGVARDLCRLTGMDRATFCNTGSEAVMAAIRLARTVTGRTRVAYFSGDYHGMFDEVLVRGSWLNGEYRATAVAPGIPESLIENMLVLDYDSPASLEILREHAGELAAVLVEPVQSRRPGLRPDAFLQELRAVTARAGAALVFDEVVTGFRCHPGGAQAYFGVHADMATYGKVIGAGIPIGILTGTKKFMDALDGGSWQYGDDSFPEVGVTFFAGTFVRHPMAMAAARAVIDHLHREGPGLQLEMTERTGWLCRSINEYCIRAGVPLRMPFFSAVTGIEHDPGLPHVSLLWYYLRDRGIHIWEGRPVYLTTAHSDADLDAFSTAFCESVEEMQEAGFLPAPEGPRVPGVQFPREDRAPTTEAQKEILFSARLGDDANRAYNESSLITLRGPLDLQALERSMLHVIQRHPALRSTFTPEGDGQVFHPVPKACNLPLVDLSGLSAEEAQRSLREAALADSAWVIDLVRGPLLRARLFRMSADRHVLLFTAHHLICDGWSFGMIVDDLSRSYTAFRSGNLPMLPPPLAFGDYARALPAAGTGPDRAYWMEVFSDIPPPLDLPCDRPRPLVKTFAGAMESVEVGAALYGKLKSASPSLGGTVFSTLLAAYAALLHRLTGADDLVIGVPSAGQTLAGNDHLVGHCLNFLPVRLRPSGSFAGFCREVSRAVLAAYEHQSETFGSILSALKVPRHPSRIPLVSAMFNIDRSGFDRLRFDGLDFEVETNPKQFVNFDIFFNLQQSDGRLVIECEYNTDLFDASTIRRWISSFEVLLQAALDEPGTGLDVLDVLACEERRLLFSDAETTRRPFDSEVPVHLAISRIAEAHPDQVAVICGESGWTYSELERRADRIAARLQGSGVRPGDSVGLCMERSIRMVAGLLGILKTGAAYIPMDPAFPRERLRFMCEDASMRVILAEASTRELVADSGAELVDFESETPASASRFRAVIPSGESPAYVIFTSGSTGRPKGVVVPHRALMNFLHSMRQEPGLGPDDVLLAVTTLSFDISGLEIFLPLTTGATVVIASQEAQADGNLLAGELARHKVSVMQATPATWRILLDSGWSGSQGLKILVGGEAVPRELVNRLDALCDSLWNVYGPTETTIWSTAGRLSAGTGPVLIGRPIDNTQVFVVSPSLRVQPTGVVGELLIGGAGVALGYLNRPELTAEKFVPGPEGCPGTFYRTGDLARRLADGSIECLGRVDHQIKVRGFRIEPGEIESLIEKFPGVLQAVVQVQNGRLAAYFRTSSSGDIASALRAHLSAALPDYMVPSFFMALEQIPTTPNGKVDRKALPAPDLSASIQAGPPAPPRNETERRLAEIWASVLGLPGVGIRDDIFELGGDSILIFQISARSIAEGIPVRPADIFLHRTVEGLAAKAAPSSTSQQIPSIKKLKRDEFRRKA